MSLRSVILVVLADGEHSGYEITKEFETVLGYFWSASHQQVYRELGKMHDEGLVRCRLAPQAGKPDRKVYSITDTGRAHLLSWLEAPAAHPPVRNPLLVKVYAGMLLGPDRLAGHVDAFRKEAQDALARFGAIRDEHYKEDPGAMEDWKKLAYLTLRYGMLRREADQRWAAEALRVMQSMGQGHDTP